MKKFYKGMDISSLPEYLAAGETFYDASGKETEPFALLAANGVNSIRLRLWNEPERVPESGGWCSLADTIAMGKRIKEYHMHFVLDFHYSDWWADPGQQNKPYAWKELSFSELTQAVYDYTSDVLTTLREEGCLPDMVQVGNEIRSGMLFPDGAVPHYDNLAALLNAGIRAVRDTSLDIAVMIHLDQGGRFYYLKEWFDNVFAAGLLPIDAIGISFYSFWHGTFMDLRDSMRQLIETYRLPVFLVETAHPWRSCPSGHISEDQMKTAGLPAGIAEQKKSLQLIMQIVSSVSGGFDTGIYYWEPLCIPAHGHGTWAENMGMLDENGHALESFSVFREFTADSRPIEDLDAYIETLYQVDEDQLPPAGTNLIPNGDFSDGDQGWWMFRSPKDIDVTVGNEEISVSSKENFTFEIMRDVHIDKAGTYLLSVDYRGTNTTGVRISLFLRIITCNGETAFQKEIFPTDVAFVTQELAPTALPAGHVQVGVHMEAPPVFGRIKNFRLVETEA